MGKDRNAQDVAKTADEDRYRPTNPEGGVSLPYPDPTSRADIQTNAQDSSPDWIGPIQAPQGAPNVVLIMTDDVGFGAADTFGGPVRTPTMSMLAEQGLRYNRFHTTAMCSPTRAALLTGRHPHKVGTGFVVDGATGYPGYISRLPKSCATIGQILQMNGFATGWFGKNHNVPVWESSTAGPFDQWPNSLGFEKFYGFIGGEASQYHPLLFEDTVPITPSTSSQDYHLDTDLADQAIQFINNVNAIHPGKPFFVYYVPGATHAPHHVPEDFFEYYKGRFNDGWDALRQKTLEKQKELGICPETTELTARPENIPSWDSVDDPELKDLFCRMMEVYCGFLEMTDHNIGRVLNYIDELGKTDNTLVIYIQGDNGGSAEGSLQGTTNESVSMGNRIPEPIDFLIGSKLELGSPLHDNHMPVQWAWALNSPMQWAKRYASHFGGTRNGMVMRWPETIKEKGAIRTQFHHVIDILPTILEACKIQQPINSVNGTEQQDIDGVSMTYTWNETTEKEGKRPEMIFEMAGNRGYYRNGYMLSTTPQVFGWSENNPSTLRDDSFSWELYDIRDDFSQAKDLLKENPSDDVKNLAEVMKSEYMRLAGGENQIFPLTFTDLDRSLGQVGRPSSLSSGTKVYPNRITRVPEPMAPDVKNGDFTITANIKVPLGLGRNGLEGVIYSQGGRFCGYGLVVLENRPIFVYNLAHWEEAIYKIEGTDILKLGYHTITMNFEYENKNSLGGAGTFTLYVDQSKIGSVYAPRTVSSYFSLTETLDIGQDSGTSLIEEYAEEMPFAFNGEVINVTFVMKDELSEENKKKRLRIRSGYVGSLD